MASSGGLHTARMLVVTGKGGVGKTTVTAALGDALARAGRRVLLIEVDPRESLYHLLGVPPSAGERVRVHLAPVPDSGRTPVTTGLLWIQNLQPRHVIEQMVREHLRLEILTRRVLSSTVFQHFIESAPGFKELAVLAHAMRALERQPRGHVPEADTIILDAPATGHGVSLLAAPRLVAEVVDEGPFGRMAREMTAFVADPARLGIVVVTKAEEVPAIEAIELFEMLDRRVHRTPDLLVVNGLYPPLPSLVPASEEAAVRHWAVRRTTNERELRKLTAACDVPVTVLPLVPLDSGPLLVSALARRLVPTLDIAAYAA